MSRHVVIYTKHAHQPVVTFQADRDSYGDTVDFFRGEDQGHDECIGSFNASELIGWVYVDSLATDDAAQS